LYAPYYLRISNLIEARATAPAAQTKHQQQPEPTITPITPLTNLNEGCGPLSDLVIMSVAEHPTVPLQR